MVHPSQIPSEGGIDAYPLSPIQQGMLYHCLQGAPGVDLQQVICELHEEIQPARFEQAWREVIARHTVLRTSFEWQDHAAPWQVVQPMSRVRLNFRHAEFGSEREARHGLEEYLEADRREGFPELTAPLLRVALLRGGPEHYWFVTTYHHLLLDARSMTLMFREALDRHDALVAGQTLELPTPKPYRHYIDWLQTLGSSAGESFWRAQLQGFAAPNALPLARPAADSTSGSAACGELMFRLSPATTDALRRTAGRHGVTFNTMVQAAWSLVLSRTTGDDDVVFGALRAGRKIPVEGVDEMIGLFINTVPVRSRLTPGLSVGAWLKTLRDAWVAMRAVEHTPLTNIQQWSEVSPGRPLFETLLNYQEPAWDGALNALGGKWTGRIFDIRSRPNYPLAIDVYGGAALTTKAFYDRDRFEADSVSRLLGHFRVGLEALASDAFERVADIPLLTRAEREELLVTWNRTAMAYPRAQCVHRCVAAHAAAAPDSIAVSDTNNTLTYGELNARANRMARRLRTLGVGPDALVAVCMERSTEMLVAWLAVLKAGGAFVPLDPGYPKERLAFQIKDCAARVLLTQPRLRDALPDLPDLTNGMAVLEVAADGGGFEAESVRELADDATARNLAYVIYTSGSTGQPKGVQIEHRALMNLVTWHQRRYAVTAADRATQLASPAFDASVWEIWPYLAAGASVHIPDDETRLSPALLWQWMAEKSITLSFLPTPLAEAAMSEPWPANLALRALLTGGDKLKRRPPESFPCELVNHYGPTESTVVATSAVVERHGRENVAPTIGRPIANTTVYVLDRALRVVPIGVAGELFIGGGSLARGYLGRPELDAEKFITVSLPPEPANNGRPTRLYRTGDLVRWNARGELEFLGRIDGQVKIRGCRIELGEIEATLQAHPAVRESIVIARPGERGQLQLVAYAVQRSEAGRATDSELSDFLRTRLPLYMLPAAIVVLDAWPLTPNGKIDRKALPEPAGRPISVDTSATAPRTPMEQRIARVWTDVLGRSGIGCDDNFFDLGGHSLLAAQVISRLNPTLRTPVSVRLLFDQPTLGAFARELDRRAEGDATPRLPLHRLKRRPARSELELQPN